MDIRPTQLVAWNVQLWYSTDAKTWNEVTGAIAYWYGLRQSDRYYAIVYNAESVSSQDDTWSFHAHAAVECIPKRLLCRA